MAARDYITLDGTKYDIANDGINGDPNAVDASVRVTLSGKTYQALPAGVLDERTYTLLLKNPAWTGYGSISGVLALAQSRNVATAVKTLVDEYGSSISVLITKVTKPRPRTSLLEGPNALYECSISFVTNYA